MKIIDKKTGKTKYVYLPKIFKAKWVKALRSGEFKQGFSSLETIQNTYCCLGVACKIANPKLDIFNKAFISKYYFKNKLNKIKVPKLLKGDPSIEDYNPVVSTLAGMNDSDNTFNEIADFIEKEL